MREFLLDGRQGFAADSSSTNVDETQPEGRSHEWLRGVSRELRRGGTQTAVTRARETEREME